MENNESSPNREMEKSKNLVCPNCNTSRYVVLLNNAQKTGTAVGGVVGGCVGYTGAISGAEAGAVIGSFVPVVGTGVGIIAGALAGFFTGAAIGNQVGECVDRHVIGKYRCNRCGFTFEH